MTMLGSKILRALSLLALVMQPGYALADGCNCGAVQGMITMAQLNINTNTKMEAENIRTDITEAARNIIGTIKVESATIVRAIVSLKESNVAAVKGLGAALGSQKTYDLYGGSAQPNALCGSTSVGAGLQVGVQAQTEVRQEMRDKQLEYSNTLDAKPVDYLDRISSEEHPDLAAMVNAVFPLARTLTADQLAQAHETVKTLADPRPLPVAENLKKTPAGQTYSAARLVHQGRVQSATEALNHHVGFHAPTMPDDVTAWARQQWSDAGATGTPPGLVDGKLSESALLNLLVQVRMGNPNWFTQLAASTDTGLLREIALMQAVQLQISHKNMEYLDRLSVVTALDYLSRMEGTSGKDMDTLYARMVGTQQ